MKEITAVIQPVSQGPVREALSLVGVTGMTISDVRGFGSQGGSVDTYRGVEYRVDYVPKIQLAIVLSEAYVEPAIAQELGAACPAGPRISYPDGGHNLQKTRSVEL